MLTFTAMIERLAIRYSWIGQKPERIQNLSLLLAEAKRAGGSSGMRLIDALIGRFVFLTADAYEAAILEMAEYVDATFDLSATIICAATADHTKDSGQRVLYDLCSALGALGHTKLHTANRYDHVQKVKMVPTDVVLIDEFIGTGRSFLGRVRSMRSQFVGGNKKIPKLHGIAIAGMSNGLREIAHGFDSLNVCTSLTKGIQGMAPRQSMATEYSLMATMENELCANIDGNDVPRLGDGSCEALYARSLGNCPNSVFPIFWWPKGSSNLKRSPLFTRVL